MKSPTLMFWLIVVMGAIGAGIIAAFIPIVKDKIKDLWHQWRDKK